MLAMSRSIQLGRIPVFLYNDIPWIPYLGSNYSIETYGFVAGLTATENTLVELVSNLSTLTSETYRSKLDKLHEVRHMFTYNGVFHEVDLFLKDPFGKHGGHLTCAQHPKTERCCD